MAVNSIPARLLAQAQQRPQRPAYAVRENGQWRITEWATYVSQVRQAARALIHLGFKPREGVVEIDSYDHGQAVVKETSSTTPQSVWP